MTSRVVLAVGDALTIYGIARDGGSDVGDWLRGLEMQAQVQFRARMRKLSSAGRLRSPHEWRHLGDGVYELKVDAGPGYRLYALRDGSDWTCTHGTKKPKPKKVQAEVARAIQIFGRHVEERNRT